MKVAGASKETPCYFKGQLSFWSDTHSNDTLTGFRNYMWIHPASPMWPCDQRCRVQRVRQLELEYLSRQEMGSSSKKAKRRITWPRLPLTLLSFNDTAKIFFRLTSLSLDKIRNLTRPNPLWFDGTKKEKKMTTKTTQLAVRTLIKRWKGSEVMVRKLLSFSQPISCQRQLRQGLNRAAADLFVLSFVRGTASDFGGEKKGKSKSASPGATDWPSRLSLVGFSLYPR